MRLLCLFCALLPFFAHAQIRITGKVVDSGSGIPIPYATIISTADDSGTVTNSEGNFVLRLFDGESPVRISCLGYDSVEKIISVGETIALTPANFEIEAVVVIPIDIRQNLRYARRNYYDNVPAEPTDLFANIRQYQIFDDEYIQAVDMVGGVTIPGGRSLDNMSHYRVDAVAASLYQHETKPGFPYTITPILRGSTNCL